MKVIIAIPAYNEEGVIAKNLSRLTKYLRESAKYDWEIIVADNNSTDKTKEIVQEIAVKQKNISYLFVPKKGKGAAVISAWQARQADVYCFMDADLATDLKALPMLVDSVFAQGYNLACGSRYEKKSAVQRSLLRKIFSLGYRLILKIIVNLRVKDAPCGFKAVDNKIKNEILPKIKNFEWFFDSELVILSEKLGYKIKEVPVDWREPVETGRSSQVKVFSLSINYFKKVIETKKRLRELKTQ